MPTVIVLDLSLSMGRPINMLEDSEDWTRLKLAIRVTKLVLDLFASRCIKDVICVIGYSSTIETICPFTNDYSYIRTKLDSLEERSINKLDALIPGINNIVLSNYGIDTCIEVILITDNDTGSNWKYELLPESFLFPARCGVLAISAENESVEGVKEVVEYVCGELIFIQLKGRSTLRSFDAMANTFIRDLYETYYMTLSFGHLSEVVSVYPTPVKCYSSMECTSYALDPPKELSIGGYISAANLGSPGIFSRHVVQSAVIPKNKADECNVEGVLQIDESQDITKIPSLSMLLIRCLYDEKMVGLCELRDSWWGVLAPEVDEVKNTYYLVLSLLVPGNNIVPWLGDFRYLGIIPPGCNINAALKETFPIRPSEKRSYNQNIVMWAKDHCIQADVAKLLRHARRLPEKTAIFYKDLNKLRRTALSFGFTELLDGLADVFDRECTMLPGSSHPDCALQLTHSAGILRKPIAKDCKYTISPMKTKFFTDM